MIRYRFPAHGIQNTKFFAYMQLKISKLHFIYLPKPHISGLKVLKCKSRATLIFPYFTNRGCWTAAGNNKEQWIAVEFDTAFEISAIQLQNRKDNSQWVKTYELEYSMDGNYWNTYTNDSGDTVIPKFRSSYLGNMVFKLDGKVSY